MEGRLATLIEKPGVSRFPAGQNRFAKGLGLGQNRFLVQGQKLALLHHKTSIDHRVDDVGASGGIDQV